MAILRIRKHADRGGGRSPDGSWPLAGVSIVDEVPDETTISTSLVAQGQSEGWITGEGGELVTRPGGPPHDKFRADVAHVFTHYTHLTFHTRDGDVRYKVTHQPDKYADDSEVNRRGQTVKDSSHGDGTKVTDAIYEAGHTRVDHFYRLKLVKG
jgi:hypothetical protein